MIIKSVTCYIKKANIKEFIEATIENKNNSIKEPGIISFDFFQCKDDETKFLLHEVYKSDEGVDKHLETTHFKKWSSIVEKCFSKPRERVVYIPAEK